MGAADSDAFGNVIGCHMADWIDNAIHDSSVAVGSVADRNCNEVGRVGGVAESLSSPVQSGVAERQIRQNSGMMQSKTIPDGQYLKMAKNYKQVIQRYREAPERVRNFFPHFVELVEHYDWEIPVSYAHSRLEQAKRMTIYCGIVKLHWCESKLTRKLIDEDHMSRGRFRKLFKDVLGKPIPSHLIKKLEGAELIRDKISHGRSWTVAEARVGLVELIDFATEFNEFVNGQTGFQPFGGLRGFKGRGESLNKQSTRWILRGMGIPEKERQ